MCFGNFLGDGNKCQPPSYRTSKINQNNSINATWGTNTCVGVTCVGNLKQLNHQNVLSQQRCQLSHSCTDEIPAFVNLL